MRRPSLGLLVITVGSVVAFVGLAALGWGSLTGLFGNPIRAAGLGVIVAAAGASLFSGIHLGGCVQPDSRERWRLAPLAGLSLLIAGVPPVSDRLNWGTFGGDGVRTLGLILLIAGATLRVGPMFVLGERFTWPLASQTGTPLRSTGFYRWIRHPSYAGAFVGGIGWALLFRSGPGLALVAALIPFFIPVVWAEEALLDREYGPEYAAYRRRTWYLFPFLY